MTGKSSALFAIAMLLMPALLGVAAGDPPRTWISPENPRAGEPVRFYYEDENATQVFITVYDASGDKVFIRSNYGHDGDVWWIEVRELPAGDYYYKIDASGPDRYGNHTEVHFHVDEGEISVDDSGIHSTLLAMGLVFAVVGAIILILRRVQK